ncbi:peptidoglycan-binding domain-containing protein [Magnetovibrio sp.]|uniref:peptidoglycan-binding domain-containing protein n=1 Tax=Magnetovibrio sp. TaxID=2024836 RepID=UPI002F927930
MLAALGIIITAPSTWAASSAGVPESYLEHLATFETAAGVGPEDIEQSAPTAATNLVQRIQKGLADQGFYLGPLDGRYGPQTEAAIKAYQKSADLRIDGKATEELAKDLETGGQVSKLLGRLEKSRRQSTDAAREALRANPLTRNLIEGVSSAPQSAPRDKKACMANPEPRCLLIEAAASARDIDKPEMRDWALGEILTAQARAGLAQDAAITTRRIHDPRLIMVALRDIAKARAEIGQIEDALAAVDIIPDPVQQVEAYVAIAEIQSLNDSTFNAAQTVEHLAPYLDRIESVLTQISFRTRISVILHKAGFDADALAYITAAERQLDLIKDKEILNKARRHIAAAYAENGMAQRALTVLKDVENGASDVPVLVAAATGLAQAGQADAALVTADSIEAVRYRALVLARIASYQAGAGQFDQARTTLDKAKEAAAKIEFPFAKAYAFSRIALAFNDVSISIGGEQNLSDEAINTTHLIKDDRLKAHIFWTIADERRRGGDIDGATIAQAEATKATDDIMSPFSRVWMLCDIAEERSQRLETDAAWSVFGLALDEAKTISNPWGRARALSKVAATMTSLADKSTQSALQPKN